MRLQRETSSPPRCHTHWETSARNLRRKGGKKIILIKLVHLHHTGMKKKVVFLKSNVNHSGFRTITSLQRLNWSVHHSHHLAVNTLPMNSVVCFCIPLFRLLIFIPLFILDYWSHFYSIFCVVLVFFPYHLYHMKTF